GRGQQFHEGVYITAQVGALLDRQPRHIGAEQVADRNGFQVLVALGVVSHAGDDAYAHAEFDVSLDHVGIDGFQQDVRLQVAQGKGVIDLVASGKGGV